MVNPVTGWFEYAQLFEPPTSKICKELFVSSWSSRYPRPKEIGIDNGTEFQKDFEQLAKDMGLKVNKSLKYNPQSNAILERVHQVLQDMLLTMDFDNADIDPNEDNPFEMGLAKAAQAIRGGFHQTHGASPCQLVFGRDMFMPKDTEVD